MPAGKIKNLIIVILALANCFLLLLVVPSRVENARRRQTEAQRLSELFLRADVELQEEVIPESKKLYPVKLSYSKDALLTVLRELLGTEVLSSETTYHTEYTSKQGKAVVDGGKLTVTLSPGRTAQTAAILAEWGDSWSAPRKTMEDGREIETCRRLVDGVPVRNGELRLIRENGVLVALESAILPTTAGSLRYDDTCCCTAQDALTAFWSSRPEVGWIGSRIVSVEQSFMLTDSDAPAAVRLRPCWAVTTDCGEYFVDGLDRTVTISTKF